ncbi:unnamed protein product [Triticum turgidum subsp. durum]|uniref:Uncharacterized protein n=1 Tax=Triticum turgidum subsp. durum TaxID=4567 RepID=A0A9R0QSJ6_TRITD|nr:unnamed protein product [Triticum turgidum subsp. durum]
MSRAHHSHTPSQERHNQSLSATDTHAWSAHSKPDYTHSHSSRIQRESTGHHPLLSQGPIHHEIIDQDIPPIHFLGKGFFSMFLSSSW